MSGQIDIGGLSVKRYFGVVAVVVGLLFALVDDFPSQPVAALIHILQWQLQTLGPMFVLYLVQSRLVGLPSFESITPWLQLLISGVLAPALFVPIALGIDVILDHESESFTLAELVGEYIAITPPVALCWIAINAPWVIGFRLVKDGSSESGSLKTNAEEKTPPFFDLIDPALGGDLLYLVAELHYLSVVTTKGKSLILYNLKDAINELDAIDGIQTHRSYWVVLSQVKEFEKIGRQGQLEMLNGDRIPVSRRNLDAVLTRLED